MKYWRWPRWPCRASCSRQSSTASSGSVFPGRWCSVADGATEREVGDSQKQGWCCAETPEDRGVEGGSGRIGVSACREGGSMGKSKAR